MYCIKSILPLTTIQNLHKMVPKHTSDMLIIALLHTLSQSKKAYFMYSLKNNSIQ